MRPDEASTGRIWRAAAFSAWGLVLFVIAVRTVFAPHVHSVFPIYQRAGHSWLAGTDLYETAGDPFRYSPLVAALFTPLSVLPDAIGDLLWRSANVSLYLAALGWCSSLVLVPPLIGSRRAAWFLLVLPLSVGSLNNGQSNVLVLGLMLAAVAGTSRGRWNLVSLCLALACLFKGYPLALALLLTACYPRRLAVRFGVALAVGLCLPFFLQTPSYVLDQYRAWIGHLQANDRHLLAPHLWYRDLRLLSSLLGAELSYQFYQIVQLVAGLGLAVFCRRTGRPLVVILGLGCCWMTVLGPATESATYLLLAPTSAWLLLDA